MATMTLAARDRERLGKGGCRAARRAGWVPAVVYGKAIEARPIQVEARAFERLVRDEGLGALVDLQLPGATSPLMVLLKEVRREPATKEPLHIDFHAVVMNETVTVTVALEFEGEPAGVVAGGSLQIARREIDVTCLPLDIPATITIDLTGFSGDRLTAGDVSLPPGVELVTDADETLIVCAQSGGVEAAEAGEAADAEVAATPTDEDDE